MHHANSVLRQPLYLALDARTRDGVQFLQLRGGPEAYFDSVGHGRKRGFQG